MTWLVIYFSISVILCEIMHYLRCNKLSHICEFIQLLNSNPHWDNADNFNSIPFGEALLTQINYFSMHKIKWKPFFSHYKIFRPVNSFCGVKRCQELKLIKYFRAIDGSLPSAWVTAIGWKIISNDLLRPAGLEYWWLYWKGSIK